MAVGVGWQLVACGRVSRHFLGGTFSGVLVGGGAWAKDRQLLTKAKGCVRLGY